MPRGEVHTPWTDAERQQLRQLCENGLQRIAIARLMGRSVYSVSRQLQYLGLKAGARWVPGQAKGKRAAHKAPASTLPPLASLQINRQE